VNPRGEERVFVIAMSTCDEAIQSFSIALDCFASLAMTILIVMRGLDPRIHLEKFVQEDGLPGQARQ